MLRELNSKSDMAKDLQKVLEVNTWMPSLLLRLAPWARSGVSGYTPHETENPEVDHWSDGTLSWDRGP